MRKLALYVNGKRFIIEECEGEAEIRFATEPKINASRSCTLSLRSGWHDGGGGINVRLEVEIVE